MFSNGVWFASQVILVGVFLQFHKGADWTVLVKGGAVYTAATTFGSTLMHWVSMRYIEKGARRIGSYGK